MKKNFMSPVDAFTYFLIYTLIPDLRASGDLILVEEFKAAIRYMRGAEKVNGVPKRDFISHLNELEKDYRESRREGTADDLRSCASFIYWTNHSEE